MRGGSSLSVAGTAGSAGLGLVIVFAVTDGVVRGATCTTNGMGSSPCR